MLFFLVFFIVAHAGGRYLFDAPIPGFADVIELSMVAIVFPAMLYVTYKGGNVEVTVLVSRFPKHVQQIIVSVVLFIGVGVAALFGWQGWVAGVDAMNTGQSTVSLEVPHFPFKFVESLGFSLMCLGLVLSFLHSLGKR